MAGEGKFIENLQVGKVSPDTSLNGVLGNVTRTIETVTATNAILASESGKVFFLNSTTEFVSTLPLPGVGLEFEFIVVGAPSGASYTIVTSGSANLIYGVIASAEDAAGSVGCAAAGDTITFVDGKAIRGDRVKVVSDGTSWYASGFCNVQDGMTITQAS